MRLIASFSTLTKLSAVTISCLLSTGHAATNLLSNVAEAAKFKLAYEFQIPENSPGWNGRAVDYLINNTASIAPGSFSRVAYYMELINSTTAAQTWVYVSMDAFTNNAALLGVPNTGSGEYYNFSTKINNANIFSNVAGITQGTGISTVNLEFWPSDYAQGNGYGVPGASGSLFDFGDGGSNTTAGHGTMQIHNYGAGQTLFAYNAWGGARTSELGMGNQPGPAATTNTDWTFNSANISTFSVRTLQILVTPEPSRALFLMAAMLPMMMRRRRQH